MRADLFVEQQLKRWDINTDGCIQLLKESFNYLSYDTSRARTSHPNPSQNIKSKLFFSFYEFQYDMDYCDFISRQNLIIKLFFGWLCDNQNKTKFRILMSVCGLSNLYTQEQLDVFLWRFKEMRRDTYGLFTEDKELFIDKVDSMLIIQNPLGDNHSVFLATFINGNFTKQIKEWL